MCTFLIKLNPVSSLWELPAHAEPTFSTGTKSPRLSSLPCPPCYLKMSAILSHRFPCHIRHFTNPTDLPFCFFCQDTDFPIFLSQFTGSWASPAPKSLLWNALSQRMTSFSLTLPPAPPRPFSCGPRSNAWAGCGELRGGWALDPILYQKLLLAQWSCISGAFLRSSSHESQTFCRGRISLWGYDAPAFSSGKCKNLITFTFILLTS